MQTVTAKSNSALQQFLNFLHRQIAILQQNLPHQIAFHIAGMNRHAGCFSGRRVAEIQMREILVNLLKSGAAKEGDELSRFE